MLPPGAINEGPPVTPRPSATVLVVRGRDPWELLLVHRPGGSDFAAGAYVFPGGTVHAGDMGWGEADAQFQVLHLLPVSRGIEGGFKVLAM